MIKNWSQYNESTMLTTDIFDHLIDPNITDSDFEQLITPFIDDYELEVIDEIEKLVVMNKHYYVKYSEMGHVQSDETLFRATKRFADNNRRSASSRDVTFLSLASKDKNDTYYMRGYLFEGDLIEEEIEVIKKRAALLGMNCIIYNINQIATGSMEVKVEFFYKIPKSRINKLIEIYY